MAESGPPRIARQLLSAGGRLKVLHPHSAPVPHSGGGGLAQSFGGGAAPQRRGAGEVRGESGDPAVTGQFERSPYATWFGHTIGGGELTSKGQQDKEDFDTLKAGRVAYAQAIANGAQDHEAAQAAVKAGGVPLLVAMSGHPDNPLSSSPAMHAFLSGQGYEGGGPQQTQIRGADGKVYNVTQNPDGSISNPQDVGLPGPTQKSQMVNTREGMGRLGPTGDVVPVFDASGLRAQTPQSAAELKAAAQGSAPAKARATTQGQTQELTNINTVLENINKLRNSAAATGSLGWGSMTKLASEKTPLSGPLGEAYNEAYNQMKPALLALTRTPGQNSKIYASGQLDQLPDPAHVTAFNMNQVLPSIQLQMRERLGMLVQNYAPSADNRPGAYTQAVNLAKVYDAHPVWMQDLQAARAKLQTDPASLTDAQYNQLKIEADSNRLSYDDWTGVERQALQRGGINTTNYAKLVAANPDLGNIPQHEVLPQNSPYRKQVPQDRTQAPAQTSTLPPQSVTTQAPQELRPPQGGQPQPPTNTPAAQQPLPPPVPVGQAPGTAGAPTAGPSAAPPEAPGQQDQQQGATAAPQGASAPIPPAQQPLAQPAPGQASGVPPQAGGSQALAPSPQAPLTPLSAETMQLLQQNNVPTDEIEKQQD